MKIINTINDYCIDHLRPMDDYNIWYGIITLLDFKSQVSFVMTNQMFNNNFTIKKYDNIEVWIKYLKSISNEMDITDKLPKVEKEYLINNKFLNFKQKYFEVSELHSNISL